MLYRPSVDKLLENYRTLVERAKLDGEYQKVSKEIWVTVPYVHLGFNVSIIAYRNDRLKVGVGVKNRKDFRLHIFEPK